ncbi:hypothetical protein SCHPADRAFT_897417 [Schizopora paradoxa]|uniref:Uncharacterized protein n=1 Tax=Schizopora paradoxa TaxID=27342 RepID=A0A0H2QWL2_9AGAM|nr:hypothetical protein SCHPADRAFT_897417 [Schizopora paradoxa]
MSAEFEREKIRRDEVIKAREREVVCRDAVDCSSMSLSAGWREMKRVEQRKVAKLNTSSQKAFLPSLSPVRVTIMKREIDEWGETSFTRSFRPIVQGVRMWMGVKAKKRAQLQESIANSIAISVLEARDNVACNRRESVGYATGNRAHFYSNPGERDKVKTVAKALYRRLEIVNFTFF